MTFNEIIQKMNEVELTTEYLGKYVRYEECFIYDDDGNIKLESMIKPIEEIE